MRRPDSCIRVKIRQRIVAVSHHQTKVALLSALSCHQHPPFLANNGELNQCETMCALNLVNEFAYRSLSDASKAFRTIDLLPDADDAPIRVQLYDGELTLSEPFEALSYAWGDQIDRVEILCDDQPLLVTTNLAAALRELRRAGFETQQRRRLWVDAICINQSDVGEKNHQVAMMKDIYSHAKGVVVWLGEADEDTPTLLKFFERVGVRRQSGSGADEYTTYYVKMTALEIGADPDMLAEILLRFFRRDWFQRAWVTQEFALAPAVELRIGGHLLDTKILEHVCIRDLGLSSLAVEAYNLELLYQIRGMIHRREELGLTGLAKFNLPRKCRDPRDKIYSILGLCSTEENYGLIPDYSKPIADVYREFASASINNMRSLYILALSNLPLEGPPDGLPSWVTDWRREKDQRTITPPIAVLYASKGTDFWRGEAVDENKLHLKGNIIDRVALVCPTRFEQDCLAVGEASGILQKWTTFVLQGGDKCYMATRERMLEAFVRTLATDYSHQPFGGGPPSSLSSVSVSCVIKALSELNLQQPITNFEIALDDWKWEPTRWYDFDEHVEALAMWNWGRRLFITEKGRIGVGAADLRVNDVIGILYGGQLAYTLRPQGEEYLHVGACYVHGVMNGEAVKTDESVEIVLI